MTSRAPDPRCRIDRIVWYGSRILILEVSLVRNYEALSGRQRHGREDPICRVPVVHLDEKLK
jgi:hypothetical protein